MWDNFYSATISFSLSQCLTLTQQKSLSGGWSRLKEDT